MAILTARQPDVRAPNTSQLVNDAFRMISTELAARTDLARLGAQNLQQDLVRQAAERIEVGRNFQNRFENDRQMRMDDLNQKLQLAGDARAERRLVLDEKMAPLDMQGKLLNMQMDRFNLGQAQTLAPYKVAGAQLDLAQGGAELNEADRRRRLDEVKIPVIEGEANLQLQSQELAKVARTSLQNVKTPADINGWLDSHMANLPGEPDQQAAEVMSRINELGLPILDRAQAEREVRKRVLENKALSSRSASALFPQGSTPLAEEMIVSGSSFMQSPTSGDRTYLSEIPLPEINRIREQYGKPAMSPDEYNRLPKPDLTSAEIRSGDANVKLRATIFMRQATELMQQSNDALQYGDMAASEKYKQMADEAFRQATLLTPSTGTPGAPVPGAAPPTMSSRRASVLGVK